MRAECAPKCAPIPLRPLSPCRPGTPAYRGPTSEARCDRESRLWRPVRDSCVTSRVGGLGETACPSRTVIRSQDPYFRFTPRTPTIYRSSCSVAGVALNADRPFMCAFDCSLMTCAGVAACSGMTSPVGAFPCRAPGVAWRDAAGCQLERSSRSTTCRAGGLEGYYRIAGVWVGQRR